MSARYAVGTVDPESTAHDILYVDRIPRPTRWKPLPTIKSTKSQPHPPAIPPRRRAPIQKPHHRSTLPLSECKRTPALTLFNSRAGLIGKFQVIAADRVTRVPEEFHRMIARRAGQAVLDGKYGFCFCKDHERRMFLTGVPRQTPPARSAVSPGSQSVQAVSGRPRQANGLAGSA